MALLQNTDNKDHRNSVLAGCLLGPIGQIIYYLSTNKTKRAQDSGPRLKKCHFCEKMIWAESEVCRYCDGEQPCEEPDLVTISFQTLKPPSVAQKLLIGIIVVASLSLVTWVGLVRHGNNKPLTDISPWIKAAENGDAASQAELGWKYFSGEDVPQNYKEAYKWFRKSADQGNSDAQTFVGWMYYEGEGISQNYAEALKWYRMSADQGNESGQYNLAGMYGKGIIVAKDYNEALNLYLKAANQGNADAMANLGVMYSEGIGVRKDYVQAYKWLHLSIASLTGRELENAHGSRASLAAKMTAQQIAEGQRLAREWAPEMAR